MRTYGRITLGVKDGVPIKQWVVVETDADGHDDNVWLTTLCQVLLLNLNESPFYSDWGIPARQSVAQQTAPDFWVALSQQRFSPHFAALTVAKRNVPTPTYDISVITQQGAKLNFKLGIPF